MEHYYLKISSFHGGLKQRFATPLELDRSKKWGMAITDCVVPSKIKQIELNQVIATVHTRDDHHINIVATESSINGTHFDDVLKHLNRHYMVPY